MKGAAVTLAPHTPEQTHPPHDLRGLQLPTRFDSQSGPGGSQVQLGYDPLGRLYQLSSTNGPTTRFLYDGDALVAEYDGAGTMTKRYAHWVGADVPLVSYEGASLETATARWLFADHQGSIIAGAHPSGATAWVNTYDEYGIPGAGNSGRFQYTGQIWLQELGMYHYKARVYSPTLGRFLQTDPVGYDDQLNLYAYVGNDPVNQTDPSGMSIGECDTGSRIAGGSSGCRVVEGYAIQRMPDRRPSASSRAMGIAGAIAAAAQTPTSVPSNIPGGPYEAKPPTPNNREGSFQGPRQPRGPRPQVQWVPPEAQGGPPGSRGYWKAQQPGQRGWRWYDRNGRLITPQQAHPNPPDQSGSPRGWWFLGPVGALICLLFCASPAY